MALAVIAEAVLRLEYKIDLLLKHLKVPAGNPMHFTGATCPACQKPVEYFVDIQKNVVSRKCDCRTGKQPMIVPLYPVNPPNQQQESKNALADPSALVALLEASRERDPSGRR